MIISAVDAIELSPFVVFAKPFPYAVSPRFFSDAASAAALKWLETEAPWQLVETDFYEQYEFSFIDANVPTSLAFLKDVMFLGSLREKVQTLFGVSLHEHIDATAHRLIPGQRIRIHNDFLPGAETHRLLIQLNRGLEDKDGGLLLFFNSNDPEDVHKVFRPAHNSAVAFAISTDSNHAVTTVHGNERFTLVYSFYAER
jgi:2OG-Fe(II) oxygenase superfamily